jgi:hypothetical protein
MNRYSLASFGISAITTALLLGSSGAHAQTFWRTMSPFYCSVFNRDQQWGPAPYDYTITNLSPAVDMHIACGVPNDNNLRHRDHISGATGAVTIVGTVAGQGITNAAACVSYYSATGGSCGNQTNITSGSPYNLMLDTTQGAGSWQYTTASDMPYVFMVLKPCTPSGSCTAYNTLRGYKITPY